MLRRHLTAVVAAGTLAVVAAGCAPARPPQTGIDKLEADLVFGIEEATTEAAPPGFNPPPPVTVGEEAIDFTFTFAPDSTTPRPRVFTPSTAKADCPDASLTAFPDKQADLNVSGPPREGRSRWKRSGTRKVGTATFNLTGFENRLVRRVATTDAVQDPNSSQRKLAFTFQTVRPLDGGKLEASTFRVNTAALANDPESGISLRKVEIIAANGTTSSSFAPSTGLLYLPLPVVPGATFTSRAADPTTGKVATLSGKVLARERVDACGDVVDAWAVDATITVQGAVTESFTTHYLVATQLGGIIISTADDGTVADGPVKAKYSLAQSNPAPLADSER